MIFIEFVLLTIWCGLGVSAFASEMFDVNAKGRNYTTAQMLMLYIACWFVFAYVVFELGQSPVLQFITKRLTLSALMIVLTFWPAKSLVLIISSLLKRNGNGKVQ